MNNLSIMILTIGAGLAIYGFTRPKKPAAGSVQARAEIRAQRKDLREQAALQRSLDAQAKRERAAVEKIARENRKEELAKSRHRVQQVKLAAGIARSVFKTIK